MFSRSADHAEISPPAVVPEGPAAPGPPPGRSPQQRHFDRIFVGVVLILVGGAIGMLLIRNHASDARAARAQARADASAKAQADSSASAAAQVEAVKQAYLANWTALAHAELVGNSDSLKILDTPSGYAEDQQAIASLVATGYRYRLTAEHDPQVVVYSSGTSASVDDLLVRHMTRLDPTTLDPVGPVADLTMHVSGALKLVSGSWLVDSTITIGADGSDPQFGLSYVAADRGSLGRGDLLAQLQTAYLAYWDARRQAFQNLSAEPLSAVATGSPLQGDIEDLSKDKAKNEGLAIRAEHNFRIALRDPDTAYVYDTRFDSSYLFDFSTKRQLAQVTPSVVREFSELKKVPGGWMVDLVGAFK